MARRGTCIALVVGLAVGCAESELKQVRWVEHRDGAVDDDGAVEEEGGGAGGMGSAAACMHAPPNVYACVQGAGIPQLGTGEEAHLDLTGTVERTQTDPFDCGAEADSRAFGSLGHNGQTYLVHGEETAIALTIATGSGRPVLEAGQRVRVTVDDTLSGSLLLRDDVVLSVRDEADDKILYWFAQTDRGPERIALPPGLSASDVGPECSFDASCGTEYRRALSLSEGNDDVAIAMGELGSIVELDALLLDNTELVLDPTVSCFDTVGYQRISIALFANGLVTKCDWREEDNCTGDDDCREVRAHLSGAVDEAPSFIACVEDNSCSDGDVVTCAINDLTEQRAEFSTNCVPPGWHEAQGACDPDGDAGSM